MKGLVTLSLTSIDEGQVLLEFVLMFLLLFFVGFDFAFRELFTFMLTHLNFKILAKCIYKIIHKSESASSSSSSPSFFLLASWIIGLQVLNIEKIVILFEFSQFLLVILSVSLLVLIQPILGILEGILQLFFLALR